MDTKKLLETGEVAIKKLQELKEKYGDKVLQYIKEGKFREDLKNLAYPELAKADTVPFYVQLLTKDYVANTLKENIVPESNAAAALLRKDKDNIYLYTAYLKDSELLPVENNKYLIFIADAIARDLEAIFDGKELIVLN